MKICMLVNNTISMDARVKGEALALQRAGHEVTVVGVWLPGCPREEMWQGVCFRRVPVNRHAYGMTKPWKRFGTVIRNSTRALRSAAGAPTENTPTEIAPPRFSSTYPPARQKKSTWRRRWTHRRKKAREHKQFLSAVSGGRYDVIHAHDLETLDYAWAAAQQQGAKLVYDSHELWLDLSRNHRGRPELELEKWERTESDVAPKADLVITVCKAIARELQQLYGLPELPLVVRNCAELTADRSRQDYLRETFLHTPSERPIVLYQGGVAKGRGLELLVEIAKLLPQADFVIIGPGTGGTSGARLLRQAGPLSNLFLLPPVPYEELWKVTASADLGYICTEPVCKCYDFAMANKLFQYMAAGLPFVASDIKGHRELQAELSPADQDCLKIIPYHDPQGAATVIDRLLQDRAALRQLGARWREIAAAQFNQQQEMQKLVVAYAGLESRLPSANRAA